MFRRNFESRTRLELRTEESQYAKEILTLIAQPQTSLNVARSTFCRVSQGHVVCFFFSSFVSLFGILVGARNAGFHRKQSRLCSKKPPDSIVKRGGAMSSKNFDARRLSFSLSAWVRFVNVVERVFLSSSRKKTKGQERYRKAEELRAVRFVRSCMLWSLLGLLDLCLSTSIAQISGLM